MHLGMVSSPPRQRCPWGSAAFRRRTRFNRRAICSLFSFAFCSHRTRRREAQAHCCSGRIPSQTSRRSTHNLLPVRPSTTSTPWRLPRERRWKLQRRRGRVLCVTWSQSPRCAIGERYVEGSRLQVPARPSARRVRWPAHLPRARHARVPQHPHARRHRDQQEGAGEGGGDPQGHHAHEPREEESDRCRCGCCYRHWLEFGREGERESTRTLIMTTRPHEARKPSATKIGLS